MKISKRIVMETSTSYSSHHHHNRPERWTSLK